MSRRRYATPLLLEPGRSRWLAGLLVGSHGIAIAVLPPLACPSPCKLAVAALILFSLLLSWRRHISRRGRHATLRMLWEGSGRWRLYSATGESHDALLSEQSVVTPAIGLLHFRLLAKGGWRNVIILPDNIDHDRYRRFRVRLRLEGVSEQESL